MSVCYVYIVATVIKGVYMAPIKVGLTSNIDGRMASLQTGSAHKLTPVHWLPVPTRDIAADLESMWHQTFAENRMSGEWFNVDPLEAVEGLTICAVEWARAACESQDQLAELIEIMSARKTLDECVALRRARAKRLGGQNDNGGAVK